MELMIKHSEILTIIIQSFLITTVSIIFIGCWDEVLYDTRKFRRLLKKRGGKKHMREYTCPKCGYSAWALDHLLVVTCRHCGTVVETKHVPACENERSFVCDEKKIKRVV